MSLTTIVVVDDAPHWRRFIGFVVRIDPALEVICEVSNGADAVAVVEEVQPAIVLLDIGLPGICGIEAARRILERAPNSRIIFVSQQSDIDVVQEALSVGAAGYVLKIDAGTQLVPAIHCALRGQTFISRSVPVTATRTN
jgi:DNA-binding NarL/FixJ family response regulator